MIRRYSTDLPACAELRRHLWASGRWVCLDCEVYFSKSLGKTYAMVTLESLDGCDSFVFEEGPVTTDPIATECVAWCKVALLASLNETAPTDKPGQ